MNKNFWNFNIAIYGFLSTLFILAPIRTMAAPATGLTGIWVGSGEEKTPKEDRPFSLGGVQAVKSLIYDGKTVRLRSIKNEVVNFALVLESGSIGAKQISVEMTSLTNGLGSKLEVRNADEEKGYLGAEIEPFFIRYLPIKGLSQVSYGGMNYDERHVPAKFRRPFNPANGEALEGTTWSDRPDAEKNYPEIAVPLSWVPSPFSMDKNVSQMIWFDVYSPRYVKAGKYTGTITVKEAGVIRATIPVELELIGRMLPDDADFQPFVFLGAEDIQSRYMTRTGFTGKIDDPLVKKDADTYKKIIDLHFQMAKRHRISLIDSNKGYGPWDVDQPRPEWFSRLNGDLFSPLYKYDGPGLYTGNGVYSIGTYGSWDWQRDPTPESMNRHLQGYSSWFAKNSSKTEAFLYLIDETADAHLIQMWSKWMDQFNSDLAFKIKSFATIPLPRAVSTAENLDLAVSTLGVASNLTWPAALSDAQERLKMDLLMYNGARPSVGSFATEDESTSLRMIPYVQEKFGIRRWFFWSGTYYSDYQGERGATSLFRTAHTFGRKKLMQSPFGETGDNYSNGDGVLFYPGTDLMFPEDSYNHQMPIASLRLKFWRRGIQDRLLAKMASKVDSEKVKSMIASRVPKVLWEVGVDNEDEPSYVHSDISWSNNWQDFERDRLTFIDMIKGANP